MSGYKTTPEQDLELMIFTTSDLSAEQLKSRLVIRTQIKGVDIPTASSWKAMIGMVEAEITSLERLIKKTVLMMDVLLYNQDFARAKAAAATFAKVSKRKQQTVDEEALRSILISRSYWIVMLSPTSEDDPKLAEINEYIMQLKAEMRSKVQSNTRLLDVCPRCGKSHANVTLDDDDLAVISGDGVDSSRTITMMESVVNEYRERVMGSLAATAADWVEQRNKLNDWLENAWDAYEGLLELEREEREANKPKQAEATPIESAHHCQSRPKCSKDPYVQDAQGRYWCKRHAYKRGLLKREKLPEEEK